MINQNNSEGGFQISRNHKPTGVIKKFMNLKQNKINQQLEQHQLIINQKNKIKNLRQDERGIKNFYIKKIRIIKIINY